MPSAWVIVERADELAVYRARGDQVELVGCADRNLDVEVLADQIHSLLVGCGYRGQAVLVALAAESCLCATMAVDRRATGRDRQLMSYALEAHLPIAAEEFASDFSLGTDVTLGVAVHSADWAALLAALEARSVPVLHLIPAALLALQNRAEGSSRMWVAWKHAAGIEWVRLQREQVVAWRHLREPNELRRELLVMPPASDDTVGLCIGLTTEEIGSLAEIVPCESTTEPIAISLTSNHFEQQCVRNAASVLALTTQAPLDLRQGPLEPADRFRSMRRRFAALATASLVLLLSIVTACLVFACRYERMADELASRQESVFSEIFPGRPIPVGVRSRLESELSRREGAAGKRGRLPQLVSAINGLHDVLVNLPEDLRFRLIELRIERDSVFLEGEARSHGDAEVIAAALRRGPWQVRPPSTKNLADQGVSMTIDCQVVESDTVTGGGD